MSTDCPQQLTLWKVGKQEVTVTFDAGQVVSDAGLLGLRAFDQELHILSDVAARLADPRAQQFVLHTKEAVLTQRIYQILADCPDGNDAQMLRNDGVFRTIVGVDPDGDQPLASGSTLNRFHNAYTRRQAELPVEDRPAAADRQAALTDRLRVVNDYFVELFIRTRRQPPACVILDLDASDDPTHGQQVLSFYHGYYEQHQYLPIFVFDGETGFPLAAWLRPGTVHASAGAVEVLAAIVRQLRAAWPDVLILVRADTGFAVPEMYELCEVEGLLYAFGYASNAVLQSRTAAALADLETYYQWYGEREPAVQRFEAFDDYQADGWSRPRRIVAKVEINRCGTNRRFVVTNLPWPPQGVYHGFYVQRGNVPEKPLRELKHGLAMDRLSCHGFRANAMRLLEHVLAYALVVLYREATAAAVPELATAEVATWRTRLWKVGALVVTSTRRIGFHLSATWPMRELFQRVHAAAMQFVAELRRPAPVVPVALLPLLK